MCVSKSSVPARQAAASDIVASAKRHAEAASPQTQRLIGHFADAADQFIRLCNQQGDKKCARLAVTWKVSWILCMRLSTEPSIPCDDG